MILTRKQKILLPLLAITLIFLIWQMISLLNGSGYKPAKRVPHLKSQIPPLPAKADSGAVNDLVQGIPEHNSIINDVQKIALDPTQQEYLRLMSEYQIAQIKRLIAKDYESIARSNRNAAQAMFETEKLSHAKGVADLPKPMPEHLLDQGKLQQNYRLVYTGQQYGKWGATLRYKNKLVDLEVGNSAPDGAKVIAINQSGVVLQQGQIKRMIGFYGNSEELIPKKVPASTVVKHSTKEQSKIASIKPMLQKQLVQKKVVTKRAQIPPTTSSPPRLHAQTKIQQPLRPTTSHQILAHQKLFSAVAKHPIPLDRKVLMSVKSKPLVSNSTKSATAEKLITKPTQLTSGLATQVKTKVKPTHAKVAVTKKQQRPAITHNKHKAPAAASVQHTQAKATMDPVIEITRDHQVIHQLTKRQVVKNKRHYSQQEQALLRVNPDNYTIQLMGNVKPKPIRKFIAEHHLQKEALFYKTYRNGQPWYVLIYQQYPDSQVALRSVRTLPIELHRWSPFVKSFQQIQAEINKVV